MEKNLEIMEKNNFNKLEERSFDLDQPVQEPTGEHSSKTVYSIDLERECFYHSGKDALTNCGQCDKPICAECRIIYYGDVLLGMLDEELCFQCMNNRARSNRRSDLIVYSMLIYYYY